MLDKYLRINKEVEEAIKQNKPVVALESTIISHGMPYPKNYETALNCEKIIREELEYEVELINTGVTVSKYLQKYLKEHNYNSILEWAKDNNVEIDLNEWVRSNFNVKRYEAAKAGYGLDVLVIDNEWYVRNEVQNYLKERQEEIKQDTDNTFKMTYNECFNQLNEMINSTYIQNGDKIKAIDTFLKHYENIERLKKPLTNYED